MVFLPFGKPLYAWSHAFSKTSEIVTLIFTPEYGMLFYLYLLYNSTQKKIMRNKSSSNNKKDKEELKKEPKSIYLPDVEDIPGQEYIKPPKFKEFADTTASSADEEGDEIWKDELFDDDDDNVSETERNLLRQAADHGSDEEDDELRNAIPDTTDADGDELNEKFTSLDLSAKDLDIPDDFEDEEDEELGKEAGDY